ncbi:MAG TPA: hypothetical protein VGG19_18450, partial [Tepidisphaeraceae bacterium]
ILLCIAAAARAGDTKSLAGRWRFALDPADKGNTERWFTRNLSDHIQLPGTLQEQGFGNPPTVRDHWLVNDSSLHTFLADPKYAPYRTDDNFKAPFWLTPKRHYVGLAWYQRDIDIPQNWKDKHIILHLERPHWQTTLWLDSLWVGSNDSLGTPHDYDLSKLASPGNHVLTLCIDNRINIPVGIHAHSVTDMSQTDWNGILGDISLDAATPIWLDNVQLYPDIKNAKVHVIAHIGNLSSTSSPATIFARVKDFPETKVALDVSSNGGTAEFDYPLGKKMKLWDEFSPHVYEMYLRLSCDQQNDEKTIPFGMRQITHAGNQLLLNGHPIMLRGTLECCVFPLTGYPPMTLKPWQRIFSIARSYGLNHLRFHTWCPPEAAFEAADEMGFYLEVECSCWARFGEGSSVDKWMPREGDRMLRAYGNHPSFLFMTATNEPKGKKAADFLAGVVQKWKNADTRRLYSAGAGAAEVNVPPSDFHIEYATRFHQANGELSRPPTTADDYSTYVDSQPIPSIAHELGQWCVYPDFEEIPKYKGFLQPGNLEIFRDFLNHSGMGDQAKDFVCASGKFQALLYKAEIEKVLRTPRMAGFELLDLHDFPGQGTSPVGVLDEFWDSKGYITPTEYAHFAGPTVLLAKFPKLVFTSDEVTDIRAEISHFGPSDLNNQIVQWNVQDDKSHKLLHGEFACDIKTNALSELGKIHIEMSALPAPAKLTLELKLKGKQISNSWNFWIYPHEVTISPPTGVSIAHDLSEKTLQKISAGDSVLVLLPPSIVAGDAVDSFEPIFWNRVLFPKLKSQTMGILCDPRQAVFNQFPTDEYSNWQWWDLQQNSKPMILNQFPTAAQPLIQLIDDWTTCRHLGLLVEGKLGNGKVIICSIDLQNHLENRPVARQLLHSILSYVTSSQFHPKTEFTAPMLQSLVVK